MVTLVMRELISIIVILYETPSVMPSDAIHYAIYYYLSFMLFAL
jgi:hypothetical protein